jgi:RimJ/RimL family protein N-acetyltransferase
MAISNKNNLTFSIANVSHEALILKWLGKPHVNEFFHGEGLKNTISSLKKFVNKQDSPFDAWIAFCDDEPFGYLMTSTVKDSQANDQNDPLAKWIEPGKKMITLDLLIGEEKYLGKGLATPMIKTFLQEKFPKVSIVFIDPECSNTKAIHAYKKAGFKKIDEFIASWNPVPHWLMIIKIKE